jgi:hypothetical protein
MLRVHWTSGIPQAPLRGDLPGKVADSVPTVKEATTPKPQATLYAMPQHQEGQTAQISSLHLGDDGQSQCRIARVGGTRASHGGDGEQGEDEYMINNEEEQMDDRRIMGVGMQ